MAKFKDLTGQKFGRLTVISRSEIIRNRKIMWVCKCECDKECLVSASHLNAGHTTSCGCFKREVQKRNALQGKKSFLPKFHPRITSARGVWRRTYSEDGLSFEDFYRLSQMPCFYCGSGFSNMKNMARESKGSSNFALENGNFYYNGLDRIDSSKGHTIDNLVTCCKWCNFAKRERSVEEFRDWVKRLHDNLFTQKEKDSSCLESSSEFALVS